MVVEECPLPVVCFISIELLTVFHMSLHILSLDRTKVSGTGTAGILRF